MTADEGSYRRMFVAGDGVDATTYPVTFGDRVPDVEYVVAPDVELAVNVALATGRPLLVLGPPGSGKTSLGFAVAKALGWDSYGIVITSRTRAQDLLWSFDNVRRLSDALASRNAEEAVGDEAFLRPGVLWWALDPSRAAEITTAQGKAAPTTFTDGAVVVVDEIDKADPGVPNDLLRPLGDLAFEAIDLLHERVTRTRARPPLVVVTSNGERTLPSAFVRRCIVLDLPVFSREHLLGIAAAHFPEVAAEHRAAVLDDLVARTPTDRQGNPAIGTAEYLDVLRASDELGIGPGDPQWPTVSASALVKLPARS